VRMFWVSWMKSWGILRRAIDLVSIGMFTESNAALMSSDRIHNSLWFCLAVL
jgi:hypothetical protein